MRPKPTAEYSRDELIALLDFAALEIMRLQMEVSRVMAGTEHFILMENVRRQWRDDLRTKLRYTAK